MSLTNLPKGHHGQEAGRDAPGPRLRRAHPQHRRLLALHALQPARLRPHAAGRPRARRGPYRQHHAQGEVRQRPLLGELRAPALLRAHRVPHLPLPARGSDAAGPHDAALARGGPRRGRVFHEPARRALPGARDGVSLRRGPRRRGGRRPLDGRRPRVRALGQPMRARHARLRLRARALQGVQGGSGQDPQVDHRIVQRAPLGARLGGAQGSTSWSPSSASSRARCPGASACPARRSSRRGSCSTSTRSTRCPCPTAGPGASTTSTSAPRTSTPYPSRSPTARPAARRTGGSARLSPRGGGAGPRPAPDPRPALIGVGYTRFWKCGRHE